MALRYAAALAAGMLLALSPACAQNYPTRPVTIVLPYTPGGAVDAVARLFGDRLAARLGQPFVIENRPGAGTGIAATYVAHAAPDGYTLLHATSTTMAINPFVYKSLSYDPVKDLAPVGMLAGVSFVLVVNPKLPIRNVADFIAVSKATPGGLSYASFGYGSAAHLYAELLKSMVGIEGTHIPYKGSPPALNDIIGGHVAWMFGDFNTAMPLVREGLLRGIGLSTADPVPAAPDIPPLAAAGVPGYDASAWQMLVAPAGTPKAIVDRLNTEIRAIAADPDVQKELSARGFVPVVSQSPAELQQFVKTEMTRWGEVVKQAGAGGIE